MKICLLDADTLGNIDLKKIEQFGQLTVYHNTEPAETAERIKDMDIVITNKVVLSKEALSATKKLKLVCISATGYNNVDLETAKKLNIAVTNVKGYSTHSVAQTVFSYILLHTMNLPKYNEYSNSEWQKSKIFTHLAYPITELNKKTMGVIGYGTIGKQTAQIAKAFGMKVMIAQSLRNPNTATDRHPLNEVLEKSDFISVHLPLSKETANLITINELKKMKPTAFIVNTARGGIINEQDLRNALEQKIIAGAGVDVLSQEPPSQGNPLINAPNIILTPHIAWTSTESRRKLLDGVVENIQEFIAGNISQRDLCNIN